jgi:uncharacterized membrane protein (DUF373 family)
MGDVEGSGSLVDVGGPIAIAQRNEVRRMKFLAGLREDWQKLTYYERFEQLMLHIILLFVSIISIVMLVLVAIQLFNDVQLGESFMDKAVLQDTFGSILTILILLEFNHSIALSIKSKTGAVQVRIIVLIAILVVVRKLMLLDYNSLTMQTLLGLSALLVSLGLLYGLITEGHRRRKPGEAPGADAA